VRAYLDASLIVPIFVHDAFSDRALALLEQPSLRVVVSDFAAAEFASAMSRLVRMRLLSREEASSIFRDFDAWTEETAESLSIAPQDVSEAASHLRRVDSPLRTPDALHLAMARRAGAALATFDDRLGEIAVRLGIERARA